MWTRTVVLLAIAALAGCHEMVQLGTECPDVEACRDAATSAGRPDASGPGVDDAGTIVATRDASQSIATPAEFPTIGDPGFELNDGGAGSVSLLNFSLNPNTPSPVFEPWRACQIINVDLSPLAPVYPDTPNFAAWSVAQQVDVGSQDMPVIARPYEGNTFVTVTFPPVLPARFVRVPLSQELPQPMEKGKRYALSLRVQRVDEQETYTLQVYGTDTPCVYPVEEAPWAEAEVPRDQTWTKVCLSFTAPAHASQFMLVATSGALLPRASTLAFLLDDIRNDAECSAIAP